MTVSNTSTAEAGQNSYAFLNPIKAIKEVGSCLKQFVQTSYHNAASTLLSCLSKEGNLAHCAIASEEASTITLETIQKFTDMLFETGYFNNFTESMQCKRDVYLPGGFTLDYSKMQSWFPEFTNSVISSLLNIPYVEERHLYFTATLTYAWGLGTKHSDKMDYLVRIIFTFTLSDGKIKKRFLLYHPEYNNGEGEAIEVGSHEFVVLDGKSGGVNDKKYKHQAIIGDSDVLCVVVSIRREDLPNRNVSEFLEDLKNSGGKFEKFKFA